MTKRSSSSRERKAKAAEGASAPASTAPEAHRPGSARMTHVTRFGVIFAIVAVVVFWLVTRPARPGQVWSAEHGHWHDANGGELGTAAP